MVGEQGFCDSNYSSAPFWQDFEYEHGRAVFSLKYAGRSDLFEGKKIWEEEIYRELQGTYPVISLSFANVKEDTYPKTKKRICRVLAEIYDKNRFLLESEYLTEQDKQYFLSVCAWVLGRNCFFYQKSF